MIKFIEWSKKVGIVSFALAVILFSSAKPIDADAQSSADTSILQQILLVVKSISTTSVNIYNTVSSPSAGLPAIIAGITNMASYLLNISNGDQSKDTFPNLQSTMTSWSTALLQDVTLTPPLAPQLQAMLFPNPKIAATQADLMYGNVLSAPTAASTPAYIAHAAGLDIQHILPARFKSNTLKAAYLSHYNAVMAISSYNAYVLSLMGNNDSALTQYQQKLFSQASGSGWFQTVATDPIGAILRRILMFQSQEFLLFNQLLETQKQQLYAQVMTNTLLINAARNDEGLLLRSTAAS